MNWITITIFLILLAIAIYSNIWRRKKDNRFQATLDEYNKSPDRDKGLFLPMEDPNHRLILPGVDTPAKAMLEKRINGDPWE